MMSSSSPNQSKLKAWLQLIRPPNLPTVPGDPLAGFLLASLGGDPADLAKSIQLIIASVMFYVAGLIWNDCADAAEDTVHRPDRPLPSGRINSRTAGTTAGFLAGGGLGICFATGRACFAVGGLLVLLILTYNFLTKSRRILGGLNMGACRGASLLLGAAAFGKAGLSELPVVIASVGLTLYVMFVTMLAFHETRTTRLGYTGVLPVVVLIACFAVLSMLSPVPRWTVIPALIATSWAAFWSLRLIGTPSPSAVGKSIGGLLRGLILVQAAFCSIVPQQGHTAVIVIVLMLPLSSLLARDFYAT